MSTNGAMAGLGRALVHLPRRLLMGVVQAYRLLLKAWIGNSCRFEPSCSLYALRALERHGAVAGSYLAGARLLRCHPWCEGGHDPVPAQPPGLFRRLGLGGGAEAGLEPGVHPGAEPGTRPHAEPLSPNSR